MANKRMFSLSVVDTDKFLEMPISSRLLYYELGMRADDDGFVDNWKKILLFTGLKEDDLKVLISKQFILPFESGVIVIRHWRLNNYLRNDRFKPTQYEKELAKLSLDNNGVYILDTNGIPTVDTDKISIDKNSIEEKEIYKEKEKHKFGQYGRIRLTTDQYEKLANEFGKEFIDEKIKLLDEYIESNNNKNKYTNFNLVIRKAIREKWFETRTAKKQSVEPEWLNKEIKKEEMSDETRRMLKYVNGED